MIEIKDKCGSDYIVLADVEYEYRPQIERYLARDALDTNHQGFGYLCCVAYVWDTDNINKCNKNFCTSRSEKKIYSI